MKWFWLSGVIVLLDQMTKYWADLRLVLHQPVPIVPSLNLTLMYNKGAAFSMLNQAGGWQRWLFTALAVIVSAIIIVWLYRLPRDKTWLAAGLALVLGGAIGNLWDRVTLGYVIDFIDVYYSGWHWPAFNIADSAISVGAMLLILDALRK